MIKKAFIISVIIFVLSLISTVVLANNDSTNNPISDGVNNVRNVIGGAENVVEEGVSGAVNAVKDGWNNMTNNDDKNKMNSHDSARTDNMRSTGTNSGYSTTRTGVTTNLTNTTGNVWTWMILAVLGIVIIALIWYYSTQNTASTNNHSNDE